MNTLFGSDEKAMLFFPAASRQADFSPAFQRREWVEQLRSVASATGEFTRR